MPAFYPEGDEPKLADPSGRSLHKINNLLKSIDAKTGSTTITGPVTVSNEVEVTNSTGNPIPVSGTVALDSNSLAALENISVTFPATQNVNVTNAGLTINDMTSGNAKTKVVDSAGADVSYITAGTAGTPSAGVLSVQGINGGVSLPISGAVTANLDQSNFFNVLANYAADGSGLPIRPANSTTFAVTGTFWQATQPVSGTVTINNSQGATVTQSTFFSTTASTSLVAASANRKTLTVFNEGAGMLYVSVGSTCTTTAYQVRLSSGDYWECPLNQTSLAHTAVFATAGNARVTEVV